MDKLEPVVVVLGEEVEVDVAGKVQKFSEIVFPRKMKGKDLLAQENFTKPLQKSWALYASMSGTPIQLYEELDADQFEEVALKTAHLMGKRGKLLMLKQAGKTDEQLVN